MTELLAQAIAHHRAGRLHEAETLYRQILAAAPRHPDALHLLGLLSHQTGQPEDAAALLRSAIAADGSRAPYHFHLGVVLSGLGDAAAAAEAYRAALRLQPRYPDALNNLGGLLLARGRYGEAAELFRQAAEHNPADARYHANLGSVLLRLDRPREALAALETALARDPNNLAALYDRGRAHRACDAASAAVRDFRAVLARQPDHAAARNGIGGVLLSQSRFAEAAEVLREGLARHPDHFGLALNLARALERLGDLSGAAGAARRALELDPTAAAARIPLARVDLREGRLGEARAGLEAALAGTLADIDRVDALFELGMVLDRLNEAEPAFEAFAEANRLQKRALLPTNVDAARFRARVAANTAWIARRGRDAPSGPTRPDGAAAGAERSPIFFVGFPRSGTTLMEQVLAAHPEVVTTEERSPLSHLVEALARDQDYPAILDTLPPTGLDALRRDFWSDARALVGPLEGRLLIDKLPLNLIDLGCAERLFPEARVIVALRDPRDVCLSCFMQFFKLNDPMANFLDLDRTAETYAAVMELWLRYRERLSLPWMEYRYEDLITDFDGTLRRVLEFAGLSWSEDLAGFREKARKRGIATPSYRQVTGDLYTRAIGRWRAYRAPLGSALPILQPYVEAFGYPDA